MSKTSVITARVDAETLSLVDKVAKAQGRSRSWFAARAIAAEAEREAEFLAFAQQGLDDLDAGRSITHDELVRRIEARRSHKAT
jgi:predicted transcriptional regulator